MTTPSLSPSSSSSSTSPPHSTEAEAFLSTVLAYIDAHFALDGDTILKDGKPRAGSVKDKRSGYYQILIARFDGRRVFWPRARLLWYLATGEQPEQVDHINGIRDDDRLDNLRPATRSQNGFNSIRPPSAGRSRGLPRGVVQYGARFRAWVKVNGKLTWLGYYATAEEAGAVAEAARRKIAGPFVPGPTRYRRKHTTITKPKPKRR